MADRPSRGGRSSREYFNVPLNSESEVGGYSNVNVPANVKAVVSILSSTGAEKQQSLRSLTTTPPVSEVNVQMKAAIRLIGDNLEFTEYVQEYLSETNTNFCVIAAIGLQGTGKSTLLSMLAGNDHQDMYRKRCLQKNGLLYRQYAFRPASREAVESCRFQTSKISIYVTKNRSILLDCQAMLSASIVDELLQSGRRGTISKLADLCDGNLELQTEIESIQLVSFLMQICHTILLCVDWFIDIDVIRHIRTSEMLRSTSLPFTAVSDAARFKPNRTVNLDWNVDFVVIVVVHQRAKSEDFYPDVLNRRSQILRQLFADSKLDVNGSVSLGGMRRFGFIYPSKDSFELHDPIVDYGAVIRELRIKLPSLYRDQFVTGDQLLSEKQW
ncbi:unnamed protein product [Enterobius vermicularis]|uniref:Protein SMG9 n=1 Tax=Enterobius vermicularis TaxID=51028 RepID=A0A0N4V0J1_ENTVE|nr:unnamed protein product [Enterobius vermicularis]